MWKCLYIFRSATNTNLPYVGLYRNTGDDSLQVVRLRDISAATEFVGSESNDFEIEEALRPKKVFRTIFLTEGDSTFTLQAIDRAYARDVPDLGIEDLRDQLPNDRDK